MLNINNKGVTLIELLVVVSVISILCSALAFSFQGWVMSYNVEGQLKKMHIDLMNARSRAIQRGRMHFVDLAATQYTTYEDTNTPPDGDGASDPATDTQVSQIILDVRYPVTWGDPADTRIEFNTKGLSSDNKTICSNTATISNADYDCITISATRINLGRLTTPISSGGACDAANCVER
jgi:prepilin-type N-terminal cleavage/methylation domain-containing protein